MMTGIDEKLVFDIYCVWVHIISTVFRQSRYEALTQDRVLIYFLRINVSNKLNTLNKYR